MPNSPAQPRAPFFVQPTAGAANVAETPQANISESPALTPPTTQVSPPKQSTNSPRRVILAIAGVLSVVLLVAGGGAALYLTQQDQDVRQQAATSTGTARLLIAPAGPELVGNQPHSLSVTLDASSTPINIRTVQLSMSFSGIVPEDVNFEPANLTGISPAEVETITTSTGKTLTVIFEEVGNEFQMSSQTLKLGDITFTAPATGSLVIRFSAADSQIIIGPNNQDILRPPSPITYNFATSAAPDNGVGGAGFEATDEATATISATPTATVSATFTPTPTSTSSARLVSTPSSSQQQPVSGSVGMTIFLIITGLCSVSAGLYLFKQN